MKQQYVLQRFLVLLTASGCPIRFEVESVTGAGTVSEGTGNGTMYSDPDSDSGDGNTTGGPSDPCPPGDGVDGLPSYELSGTVHVHSGDRYYQNREIGLGDFDGDGHLDVAVNWGEFDIMHVAYLRGDGAGGLEAPVDVTLPHDGPEGILASAGALSVGRLNDDSLDDIAVAEGEGPRVATLLGSPAGPTFSDVLPSTMNFIQVLGTADVGADGVTDLVFASGMSYGIVGIVKGDGNGGLTSASELAINDYPRGMAVADLNGDGLPEVVVSVHTFAEEPARLLVVTGTPTGLGAHKSWDLLEDPGPVALLDLNGDGRLDVVAGTDDTLHIFHTEDNLELSFAGALGSFDAWRLHVADFNADGRDDLAVMTLSGVELYLGDGAGGLEHSATISSGEDIRDVAAGDMNCSGYPDLLVLTKHSVRVYHAVP